MIDTITDSDNASTTKRKGSIAAPVAFSALAVIGIVCWIMQLTGVGALALTNQVMWGIYLVGFMLCTGISAGCLLFASSAILFSGLAAFRPYSRIIAACSVCVGAVGAGLFIMADLGTPARFWEMLAFAQVGSPLIWDTLILLAYAVIGVTFTVQLTRAATDESRLSNMKTIAIAAFIAAICVAITSFVFVFQVARPSWNNPGQTLSFMLSALVASGAVIMLVLAITNRSGYLPVGENTLGCMARTLAFILFAEFIFVLAEIASGTFAGQGTEAQMVSWLIAGPGAPFFWVEICAFAASFVLLLQKSRSLQLIGAISAFAAVLLVKYNLLQVELFNPLLDFAQYPDGASLASAVYLPSLIEWGVVVGIIGIVCLLLNLAMRKLDLGA